MTTISAHMHRHAVQWAIIISIGLSGLWARMVYGIVIMGSVSIHALLIKSSGNPS